MKMKKTLMVVLAVVLIASLTIGGTLAYFTWTSDEANNEFQVSGKGVDPKDDDDDPTTPIDPEPSWNPDEDHPLNPGVAYAKDPQAGITEDSVGAWAIFKVVEVNNYLEDGTTRAVLWEVREGWELIEQTTDEDGNKVWYYGTTEALVPGETVYLFTDIGNKNDNGSVLCNPDMDEDDIAYLLDGLAKNTVNLKITAYLVDEVAGTTAEDAFNAAVEAGNVTK